VGSSGSPVSYERGTPVGLQVSGFGFKGVGHTVSRISVAPSSQDPDSAAPPDVVVIVRLETSGPENPGTRLAFRVQGGGWRVEGLGFRV